MEPQNEWDAPESIARRANRTRRGDGLTAAQDILLDMVLNGRAHPAAVVTAAAALYLGERIETAGMYAHGEY